MDLNVKGARCSKCNITVWTLCDDDIVPCRCGSVVAYGPPTNPTFMVQGEVKTHPVRITGITERHLRMTPVKLDLEGLPASTIELILELTNKRPKAPSKIQEVYDFEEI